MARNAATTNTTNVFCCAKRETYLKKIPHMGYTKSLDVGEQQQRYKKAKKNIVEHPTHLGDFQPQKTQITVDLAY